MTLLPADLLAQARLTLDALAQRGLRFAAAESCTGGLVTAALTSLAGSSSVVQCGFVTYSNQAKAAMLGIDPILIDAEGAVSEAVARAMAKGAIDRSDADVAVAITGIAGPGGGSASKPVGLVHFAALRRGGEVIHHREVFEGDRDAVRRQAAIVALELAIRATES
ncbi:CinA family protein [Magnetospirillum moscoviense]|uniref:Damage-inducible protein CinA n=1 Tax=Magnetospirillum moscoviense TaxID=1437059 RepID=A0A178MCB0_9PROT|nr:damage-inducible protein CinA [Magnetospirillum moscoviense]